MRVKKGLDLPNLTLKLWSLFGEIWSRVNFSEDGREEYKEEREDIVTYKLDLKPMPRGILDQGHCDKDSEVENHCEKFINFSE